MFLTASLLFLMGNAQSLVITNMDSLVTGNASTSADIYGNVSITNVGSSAVDVKVTRRRAAGNALVDSNAICWLVCFAPHVDTSFTTITLQPGETNSSDFTGHVYPNMDGQIDSGYVRYIFYDVNNPNDSVGAPMKYLVNRNVSLNEANAIPYEVYPNPAVDYLWVDAHGKGGSNARIEFTDVLGRKVLSQNFDASFGASRIAIDSLKSGVYIYGLYNGNQLIEKKKLIVRKR